MRRDVQARIRKRIRDRLDDLRMTARELARAAGHDDAWISGILSGSQGLHWKDYDVVCAKLGISPSELVRYDEAELRELTPSEMVWLRHYQGWPEEIRDRWLAVLNFFASTAQDRDGAVLLTQLRELPPSLRGPTIDWLRRLLKEGIPPAQLLGGGAPVIAAGSVERGPKRRARTAGTSRASHAADADQKVRRKV
jgi:hypothetical protein